APAGAALALVAATGALTVALPSSSHSSVVVAQAAADTAAPAASAPSDAVREEQARASRNRPRVVLSTPFRVPVVSAPSPRPEPKPLLPGCTGTPSTAGYANGRLPGSVLCDVGSGERLRADAARAYAALAQAYRQHFGSTLCLIDGYRPLGEQQLLRRTKRRYAATPGLSEHGWGVAVDLGCGVNSSRSGASQWLKSNAGRFGWHHPDWAEPGGSRPEPWHWEFGTT
ncbi:MAG: hypothetical protein JWM64_551, partial [Frankiales bacterium]|nr:hypothetical protein [Frankiales bacterium]